MGTLLTWQCPKSVAVCSHSMAGQAGAKRLWSKEIETEVTVGYSDYIIYVDESGSPNKSGSLKHSGIDPDYPIFVLNFCIFQKSYYGDIVVPKILAFKFKHFGHDNVILHEHEIHKKEGRFTFLHDEQMLTCFMNELSQLIEEIQVSVVATVIGLPYLKRHYSNPWDAYEIALFLCMERAYRFLKGAGQHNKTTHIIVEKRGKKEDGKLEKAFQHIRADKSRLDQVGPMAGFEIEFASKMVNSAGLQLADLMARPIGLQVLRPEQSNRSWNIIKDKIVCSSDGQIEGYGLKKFP